MQYLLGCRFNCSFCLVTRVQGPKPRPGLRRRGLENLLAEVHHLTSGKRVSGNSIFFLDDDFFGTPVDELLGIALQLKGRGVRYVVQADVQTMLTFRDFVRVRERPGGELWMLVRPVGSEPGRRSLATADGAQVSEETLFIAAADGRILDRVVRPDDFAALWEGTSTSLFEYLVRQGLYMVYLGLETVDQQELEALGKATFHQIHQGYEAVRYLASLRAFFVTNIVIGRHAKGKGASYGELLTQLRVPLATVFVVTAYPGTPLYREAEKEGTLCFPWDTLGMGALKYFDTLRGNVDLPGFSIYEQRQEALALNRVFFDEPSIRTRLAPYTPRLAADGRRSARRLVEWMGVVIQNLFYQRNAERGFNAPYAGGLYGDDVPGVADKAAEIATDLLLAHSLPALDRIDARLLRGGLKSTARGWVESSIAGYFARKGADGGSMEPWARDS